MSASRECLLIIGAGGHARACIDVIEMQARFQVVGLVGLSQEVGTTVLGYPVLGTDSDLERLASKCSNILIAVGQIKSPDLRTNLYEQVESFRCKFPVVISPKAHVSRHAKVGDGTIVMHGAIVNAGVRIGRNCIVNSMALLEHDVVVEDHCHISTGAIVNSGVHVGRGTFLGSNSAVRQLVNIGAGSVIGIGERVVTDCPPGTWLTSRR